MLGVYSTWPVHLFASVHQCSSLLYASLAVLQQLLYVGFVILWAVVCGAIQWVSNLHLLDLFHLRGKEDGETEARFFTCSNAVFVSTCSN